MEKLLIKFAYRVPELIAKALAGDVSAMTLLAIMGVGAVSVNLRGKKKD